MSVDVNKVFITKEVANKLNINSSYLIRLAKKLQSDGKIPANHMRQTGKSGYIFNEEAIDIIQASLKHK